jgi:glutaredoxin
MKTLTASMAVLGTALVFAGNGAERQQRPTALHVGSETWQTAVGAAFAGTSAADDNALVQDYCVRCHNERRLLGNLSLEEFDATAPETAPEVAEKMIVKLRAGIKDYSQWPTIPQLYVHGEFVGGSDIMMEMYENGELQQVLAKPN